MDGSMERGMGNRFFFTACLRMMVLERFCEDIEDIYKPEMQNNTC
jgi:hypothetical protein